MENGGSIPYDHVKSELREKGYLVLEKGTKFDLELEYLIPEEKFIPFTEGETRMIEIKERNIISYPDQELNEDIFVSGYIEFYRGEEKDLYKFPLTSSEILDLEERSREYEMNLISRFNIAEDYLETPYPEELGDIDMSLLRQYHPHATTLLEEKAGENPYWKKLIAEQKSLNREFVKEYLGEEVDTAGLESVRIVTKI